MKQGKVYLIGAGPGDPELLTLKGKRCLEEADVVVGDYLADKRILRFMRPDAEYVYVGKKAGCHTMRQQEISRLLAEKGKQGHIVARLKGGDPFVFGRGGEEIEVLKEAGVVDSGGQGLLEVFRGAIDGYHGKEVDYSQFEAAAPKITKISPQAEADIKFGYCTEFIILLEKPLPQDEIDRFREFLDSIGDSIVLVADDEIVKVHVHTNHPGQAFERALTYGQLSRMKIDNMREEHQEKLIKDAEKLAKEQAENKEPPKDHGFISVSVGEGLSQIFRELGVDYLIEGGQTMNPSTEDMLNAIEKVNAKTIYIFPNNKNIILAANQARDLTEDKEIIVVPTKTIPQGISAMISFVPEKGGEENLASMTDAISRVKTGQITYAVRDTRIDDKEIHEGDIMGIGDAGILAVGRDRLQVAEEMVAEMVDEESEIISVYYGEDVSEEDAEALSDSLTEKYPECEVELNQGGQPIYYYLISVE